MSAGAVACHTEVLQSSVSVSMVQCSLMVSFAGTGRHRQRARQEHVVNAVTPETDVIEAAKLYAAGLSKGA